MSNTSYIVCMKMADFARLGEEPAEGSEVVQCCKCLDPVAIHPSSLGALPEGVTAEPVCKQCGQALVKAEDNVAFMVSDEQLRIANEGRAKLGKPPVTRPEVEEWFARNIGGK